MILEYCSKINLIDLLNINVYLSNILLIPSIIIIIFIIYGIYNLNSEIYKCKKYYLIFWIYIMSCFIIGTIISTIHHLFMFSKFKNIKNVGKLDFLLTAPIIAINITILTIIFCIYLQKYNCNSECKLIFLISFILNLTGLSVHFLRKILLPCKKTLEEQIIYTIFHICFHYITYTGILLLIILHYINYENIYKILYIN